jgi:hypothetical protein
MSLFLDLAVTFCCNRYHVLGERRVLLFVKTLEVGVHRPHTYIHTYGVYVCLVPYRQPVTVKVVPVHTTVFYGAGGVDGSSIHSLTSEVVDSS